MTSPFGVLNLRGSRGDASSLQTTGPGDDGARAALTEIYRQTVSLRESLERLEKSLQISSPGKAGFTPAVASSALGLDVTDTPTYNTLSSTQEINATPSSYTPFGPSFNGTSTSLPTVDGIYTGTEDETLTFIAQDNAPIGGGKDIKFEIWNAVEKIGEFTITKGTPADTPIALQNGLVLSFSAGNVRDLDFFTVDVSATVGSVVDADKPFDGTRNDRPNFEYGQSVTAGSFDVNGESIQVFANDTINTVLDRINSSAAGVTATFNAGTESIVVTQDTPGAQQIAFENDSSGFVSATKLAGASNTLYTTLTTTEINTVATSYSPFEPLFDGQSTTQPLITGAYTGSFTGALRFIVKDNGSVGGPDDVSIEVWDTQQKIDDFTVEKFDAPGTEYTLANGLVVSFSSGNFNKNDFFEVDVSAVVGSRVNGDGAFDETGANRPNFDPGLSVTAGSFEINGVTIDVFANDTINTVLDRINASSAGVTAEFFAGSERIQLRSTTEGATDIVLANDTSGFLAATKLQGVPVVSGSVPVINEPDEILNTLSQFSSVQAGNLSINGVDVAIDPAVDSLNDVIARINASAANATASLDPDGNTFRINNNNLKANLTLDENATGFLAALSIANQTIVASTKKGVPVNPASRALRSVSERLDGLFAARESTPSGLGTLRGDIEKIVADAFGQTGRSFRTDFGVRFDFDARSGSVLRQHRKDQDAFRAGLLKDVDEVRDFFLEGNARQSGGLVRSLIERLETAESDILKSLGSSGVSLNLLA